VVGGGKAQSLDGEAPQGIVGIAFDSMEQARTWYEPVYQAIKPIRLSAVKGRMFVVEGVGPQGRDTFDLCVIEDLAGPRSQTTEHYVGIRITNTRVQECFRKAANNLKSEALPQPHCPFVGAHHEVELHGAESPGLRVFERVRTHRAREALAGSPGRRYVATIRHVRAPAFLIGTQEVCAKNLPILLGDKHFVFPGKPKTRRILLVHTPR
jgi:hypothetical protein